MHNSNRENPFFNTSALVAIMLMLMLSFNFTVNASPCSNEKRQHELIKMKLDPSIITNNELLIGVGAVYGDALLTHLKLTHPFIEQNPSSLIDSNTINWIDDIIWNKQNKFVTYVYMPGGLSSHDSIDYFVGMMLGVMDSRQRTVPIFNNPEDKNRFLSLLQPEYSEIVKDIIVTLYPSLGDASLNNLTNRFLTHYRKYNEVQIGFSFPKEEIPIIEIAGHSLAGVPRYYFGDQTFSVEEMVSDLISMGLPKETTIKLMGCFSACSSDTTSHTIQSVKTLLINDKLNEIYDTGQSMSFLQSFYLELKKNMPSFCGKVVGYIGEVASLVLKNVFTKEGTYTSAFAVKVVATDGEINLKREDAAIFYDCTANQK